MAEETNTELSALEKELDTALNDVENVKAPTREEAPPPRQELTEEAPPPRQELTEEAPPTRQELTEEAPPPPRQELTDETPPPRQELTDETPPPRQELTDEAPPPRISTEETPPPRQDILEDGAPPRETLIVDEVPPPRITEEEVAKNSETEPEEPERPVSNQISKRKKREQDRNARYNELLQAEMEKVEKKVVKKKKKGTDTKVEEVKEERPPLQLKMLERLRASKSFWKNEALKHLGEEKKEDDKKSMSKSRPSTTQSRKKDDDNRTIWQAGDDGDVKFVKEYVIHKRWDVRRHHDRGGTGSTLLHKACWRSHVGLVKWLIEHVRRRYGAEATETYVNSRDTIMNGVTPLMEAARTHIGNLQDRLAILKMLIDSGSKTHYKDAHGDTCLHWAARNGSFPIIKYLLHNTEGAVFTAMADNYVHKRPLDVAYALKEKKKDFNSVESYNQLMNMMKGSNVRMKITRLKMRGEREKKEKLEQEREDIARIEEEARISKDAAELEFLRQRSAAEALRQTEEDDYVEQAGRNAKKINVEYMSTREGKAEVKIRSRDIERKMRDEAKEKGEKPPKKTSKIAFAKAQGTYVHEKEVEARKQAKRDFRRKNPHDFDKREFEAMEQAAQLADRRYTKVLSDRDKQLRDDIDESSGLCSEPELNLNPYCKMYTDWL